MTEDDSGTLNDLFAGSSAAAHPAAELKGQVAVLLRQKRYEDALELLYAARRHSPDAAEISRGITLLKERLIRRYVEALGNLDAVPSKVAGLDKTSLAIGDEERALLHLIDGISSFADIVHQSRFGRFETYRALSRVVGERIVQVAPPPAPKPLPGSRRPAPPEPAVPVAPSHRWRKPLLGASTLALAAAATWWAVTGTTPTLEPAAAVAGVPSEPSLASAPPVPPPSAPSPSGAAQASPEPLRAALLEQSPASPPSASRRSSKRRSLRASTATDERAPSPPAMTSGATLATPAPAPAPAVDESDAPSLPDFGPPEAVPARMVAPARSENDRARPAPQGLVEAAARPAAVSVSLVANDITVRGSLGRSVVEQAIARAQGDFRACYTSRAAALRRDAAGTARVSLTIDEGGYATAVSVQGGPLPGIDGCLQSAAARLRTRVHPDVGLAAVAFTLVFSTDGRGR